MDQTDVSVNFPEFAPAVRNNGKIPTGRIAEKELGKPFWNRWQSKTAAKIEKHPLSTTDNTIANCRCYQKRTRKKP
jgi:hypothetical protein